MTSKARHDWAGIAIVILASSLAISWVGLPLLVVTLGVPLQPAATQLVGGIGQTIAGGVIGYLGAVAGLHRAHREPED